MTLDRIADEAEQQLATLAGMAGSDMPFPHRLHLRALGLALQCEQARAVHRWARWAVDQVRQWPAADDPGSWDSGPVLERLAAGDHSAPSPIASGR